MKLSISKSSIKDTLFFDFPLFILAINYIIYNAIGIEDYKNIFRIIALSVMIMGWLLYGQKFFSIPNLIFISLIVVQIIVNGSNSVNIIAFLVVAYCSTRDIKIDISHCYYLSLALIVLMFILIVTGVVENTTYLSNMGRIRTTLGFLNPNASALFYSSAIFLYVLSRKEINYIAILISAIFSFLIYYFTDSRTFLFADTFFVIIITLQYFFKRHNKEFPNFFLLVLVDSLFVVNLVSTFFLKQLLVFDEISSYRLSAFNKMVESSDLTTWLFGGSDYSVDSFYYMFIFGYGIILYLLFFLLAHISMYELIKRNQGTLVAFLTALFLCGTMESSIIRPEVLSMLVAWKIIVNSNVIKQYRDNSVTARYE